MSHLTRAVLVASAALISGPLMFSACASSDETSGIPASGGSSGDASISTGGTAAAGGGSTGGVGAGGTGGTASTGGTGGFGATGGTGATGATGGTSGTGGGPSCNPAFCPSVGSGTPCCQSNGDCGVDYGFGNGCEMATGPDV